MKTIKEIEKELDKKLRDTYEVGQYKSAPENWYKEEGIRQILDFLRTQIAELLEGLKMEEKDYREFYASPEFNEVPKRFPTEATWGRNQAIQEINNKISEAEN